MTRKNKQDPNNIKLQANETWSTKYPGYILRKSGDYKKVIECPPQRNNGRNYYNTYWIETTCAVCSKTFLQDKSNNKRGYSPTCSKKCWVALRTSPIGTKRLTKCSRYPSIKLPDHPRAGNNGYVREHILVMEKHLGRYITKDEHVHHIDMDKFNNSLENLHLFSSQSDHFISHGSLNTCVKELIEKGYLGFDKETEEYYVINTETS